MTFQTGRFVDWGPKAFRKPVLSDVWSAVPGHARHRDGVHEPGVPRVEQPERFPTARLCRADERRRVRRLRNLRVCR